mgnify:CR=1 FL=1
MKSLIEIPKTMKALVLHEIGKLTLDEVPVEPLRPGTVLVKIKAGSVLRTWSACLSTELIISRQFRDMSFPDRSLPLEMTWMRVCWEEEPVYSRCSHVLSVLPAKSSSMPSAAIMIILVHAGMADMQNIWLFRPGIWCCLTMICLMMWQQCANRLR